jgi:phosphopantothenoylcysteine decarboxylase/phosphopantothenate--cysteine ligase
MWQNKATQKAVSTLRSNNVIVMNPEEGDLASLHKGEGRLPNLHDVLNELRSLLNIQTPLKGKKILVSAGPTRESIDPVRFISNRSSGKMGFALAQEARNMGADVNLVSGPVALDGPAEVNTIFVETTDDMHSEIKKYLDADIIIMCAAVSDYTPKKRENIKIKSKSDSMSLEMKPTIDIIKTIEKDTNAIIVAFALETCNGKNNALEKLKDKGADYIVLNHPMDDGCGIESNYNKVSVFSKNNDQFDFKKDRKDRVAKQILEFIISKQA